MGFKKLICPICGNTFSSNAEFYSHIADHETQDAETESIRDVMTEGSDIVDEVINVLEMIKDFNEEHEGVAYIDITTMGNGTVTVSLDSDLEEFSDMYAYSGDCDCCWANDDDDDDDDNDCSNCDGDDCESCDCDKSGLDFFEFLDSLLGPVSEAKETKKDKTTSTSSSLEDFLRSEFNTTPTKPSDPDVNDIMAFMKSAVDPTEFISNPVGSFIKYSAKVDEYAKSKGVDTTNEKEYIEFLKKMGKELEKLKRE